MRVLGQAGRGRDGADGGADLGRGQQDHHGQAREEHLHPQEPVHREAGDHRGARPVPLREGDLNSSIQYSYILSFFRLVRIIIMHFVNID